MRHRWSRARRTAGTRRPPTAGGKSCVSFCATGLPRAGVDISWEPLVRRRACRRGGAGPWVVAPDPDRFAKLAVQDLQQVQNLVGGPAIQITGGLIAHQERRIGDE